VTKRPNILLITTDQHRKDALGCYDNPVIRTPNIDRLAACGVRFTRAFAACPVCAPNRASIATGRYPSIHGLWTNGVALGKSELTVMQVLRRSGYATYGAGKMHFGPQWAWPQGGGPICDPDPALAINPQPDDSEFPWYGFERLVATEDERIGPYGDYLAKHGYDVWADPHSFSYPQHATVRSVYPQEHHQTTWVADRSIEFLEQHPAERPFFMWASFVQPHHPFIAPAPYDTMYDPDEMPLAPWDESVVEAWPESYRIKYAKTRGDHEAIGMCNLSDADWRRIKAYYYGMVSLIDKQVGCMVEALERLGTLDNTVIVFTSDHGEMLGDHHLVFKDTLYDCVTGVPLIVTRPRDPSASTVRDALVSSLDIAPTILDLAGAAVPPGMQGHSLAPVLEESSHRIRDALLIEDSGRPTIRTENERLTWHGANTQGELYDMAKDPDCFENLWGRPEAADIQHKMLDRLIGLMVDNVDPLLAPSGPC